MRKKLYIFTGVFAVILVLGTFFVFKVFFTSPSPPPVASPGQALQKEKIKIGNIPN